MIIDAETKRKTLPFLSPLYEAISKGNLKRVKECIEKGNNPLEKDVNDETSLQYAVKFGKLDILKYLIDDVQCSPATKGWRGSTILHTAAETKQLSILTYLIEDCKQDPTATLDDYDSSPLSYACRGGDLTTVRYLVNIYKNFGMNVQDTEKPKKKSGDPYDVHTLRDDVQHEPLSCACFCGFVPVVKYLIEECDCDPLQPEGVKRRTPLEGAVLGGNVDVVKYLANNKHLNVSNDYKTNSSLVFFAVHSSDLKMVKYLVEFLDCDPNCKFDYLAPLHVAAILGNFNIFVYLINCSKCDPDVKALYGQKHIHYAAGFGHLNIVKYLVEQKGYDPSTPSETYCTPLYMAASRYRTNVADYLVSKRCDPLFYDHAGIRTPYIHGATMQNKRDTIGFFVKHLKCDPNITDEKGCTPLMLAAREGNLEIVKFLIEKMGCDTNIVDIYGNEVIHIAALQGHLPVLKYLINEKNIDKNSHSTKGTTPLSAAAAKGNLVIVKYLLEIGSAIEDGDFRTPMHYASQFDHLGTVKYLMDSYPSMYLCNTSISPLTYASEGGSLNVIKYFIEEKNHDPNTVDQNNGNTLMHCAAMNGHLDVISYLKNIVPSQYLARNKWNGTPIHFAIEKGHIAPLKFFVAEFEWDADSLEGPNGFMPIHYAVRFGHLSIVKYLVDEVKCDPDKMNKFDLTPLCCAAFHGNLDIIKYLLERKVNPFLTKRTAIHVAASKNHIEIVKCLLAYYPRLVVATNHIGRTPLHTALSSGSTITALYLIVKTFYFA